VTPKTLKVVPTVSSFLPICFFLSHLSIMGNLCWNL
jgi:hypothetical protein